MISRSTGAAAALMVAVASVALTFGEVRVEPIGPDSYAAAIGAHDGVVVVNMWATWCVPCREEFPELVRFERDMRSRGVTLISISMDMLSTLEDQVLPFLEGQKVTFPTYIKSAGDDDLFINGVDTEWSGALPATFVYDVSGSRRHSLIGPVTYDRLVEVVTPLLTSATEPAPERAPER